MPQTPAESSAETPDAIPHSSEPGAESGALSWEDDETRSTLVLRAAFTLLAGVYLLWTQQRVGIATGAQWGRWIWLSVICNFGLPLGIVWMFFGQGLTRLDWLKEQKHNAWNYGFDFRNWKRHLQIAGVLFALLLPFLIYFSRVPEIKTFYRSYFPLIESTPSLLALLLTIVVYMFCWEWFFRGFLLFGTAQGLGFIAAIVFQAALFGAAHIGKPPLEMYSSFVGGAILGMVCWREKSFVPAFYTHALVHVAWAILIFLP
jgi:membrane protease YdiL (CAAX protease family)